MADFDLSDRHLGVISRASKKTIHSTNKPNTMPYDIVRVEEKAEIPTSQVTNILTAVGLVNTTTYAGLLVANIISAKAKGDTKLLCAIFFAVAQCLDSGK